MLNNLFNDRRKEVGPAYGSANNVAKLVASANGNGKPVDVATMNFSVFDPNDPVQLMQLMMLSCGAFLGFRGVGKHAQLERKHWAPDTFEAGHPHEGGDY